jgi:hypothetical protein
LIARFRNLGLTLLLMVSPQVALAQGDGSQGTEAGIAVELKQKMMYLQIGLGKGPDGISVQQNGREAKLGFFGGNVEAYFSEVPESLSLAQTFRTQRIVGVTLGGIGMAALVADVVYLTTWALSDSPSAWTNARGLGLGLLVGGGLVGLVGAFLFQLSQGTLAEAVNVFNGGLLNKYLPPNQKIDLKILLSSNQQGVGLSYQF